MQHLEDIKSLLKALQLSDTFHALVIESPPGWAKSSTVEKALLESGVNFVSLGSYSTSLGLYNSLCQHPQAFLVLDDCAGLFSDTSAMAILKAATWASAGSTGERKIAWTSSSDKVRQPSLIFNGKLILLTNSIPSGKETQAFLSRTLHLRLAFDVDEVEKMLLEAANSSQHFPDKNLAETVVHFLLSNVQKYDLRKLNLRSLKMGYEIAKSNPQNWQQLLDKLLPQISHQDVLRSLEESNLSVEEQSKEFTRATGLSRRTFYYYKQGKVPERNEPNLNEKYRNLPSASCTTAADEDSATPTSFELKSLASQDDFPPSQDSL